MPNAGKGAWGGIESAASAGSTNRDLLPLLELLAKITETIGSAYVDRQRLFGELAGHLRQVVSCNGVAVFLTVEAPEPSVLQLAYAEGLPVSRGLQLRFGQHLVGTAAREKTTIVANDVSTDPRYLPVLGRTRSEMAVPLLARGRCIGIVDLQSNHLNVFGDREQHIVELVASRLALALDNARLLSELTRQNRTLTTMLEVGHEFSSLLDFEALMDVVATVIRRLIPYDGYTIFLLEEDGHGVPRLRHLSSQRYDRRTRLESVSAYQGIIGTAVQTERPVLVSSTVSHPHHAATREGIRSEVAVPLRVRDRVIGVLVLESEREHFFTAHHVETLQLLGSQLAAAIETTRLHQSIVRNTAAMQADLAAARRIQQQLLLPSPPTCPGLEIVAYNQPARAVSGDFYDFYSSIEGSVGLLVGDVSGKGAPAALYGALVLGLFRSLQGEKSSPAHLLRDVNQALTGRSYDPSAFAAATCARWSPSRAELVVANSGAPRPLLVRRDVESYLDVVGEPLGMFPETEYDEVCVTLDVGDTVVFASDGVFESRNSSDVEFGADRLAAVVRDCSAATLQEMVDAIVTAVGRHAGHVAPRDDQTIVMMRVGKVT